MPTEPLYNILRVDGGRHALVGLGFRDRPLAEKAAQNWRDRVPSGTFEVAEISVQQQEDAARAVLSLAGNVRGL